MKLTRPPLRKLLAEPIISDRDEPKMFRTLRGFLNGEEADEANYFRFSATLRIQGDDMPFEEISQRLTKGPIRLGVFVQLAGDGDDVTDSSVPWPDIRPEIKFGTITLTERAHDMEQEKRKIIFDPIPRIDGIDTSGDPLSEVRSEIYLLSGRRRRTAAGK